MRSQLCQIFQVVQCQQLRARLKMLLNPLFLLTTTQGILIRSMEQTYLLTARPFLRRLLKRLKQLMG